MTAEELQALLPAHKCGLYITHNEHRDYYEKLTDYLGDRDFNDPQYWKDSEAYVRAVATDECWQLQWYPDTPVGFHLVFAPTLSELLELVKIKSGAKEKDAE